MAVGRLRKSHGCMLLCGVLLVCGRALSQPAESAREHYAQGLKFVERGELDAAAVEFEAAYRVNPNYLVQYNLGQAYLALGRPVLALAAFETYLQVGGSNIPLTRRRQVEDLIA